MKIIYCGHDLLISCFNTLIEQGHEILKVFSNDCDNIYNFNLEIKAKCGNLGIPFTVERITEKDIEELQSKGCELIVSAAYPYKIPVYEGMPKAINIHPTLLPEGRGPWPFPWIILKQLKESGVTIHKINMDWDKGDILLQEKFDVIDKENLQTITEKSQIAAQKALIKVLNNFEEYWDHSISQSEGSYWPMFTWDNRTIDWDMTVEEIDRIVRAFGNFDSLATFDEKEWIIQDAITWKEEHTYIPGTIIERSDAEVLIAAKDGYVRIMSYRIDPDFVESNPT